jgi:hypothetical protein
MVTWGEFSEQAPDLAEAIRAHFASTELVMLGTLHADGSPRISPVEPDFVDGELMVGMIWQSSKALDLDRDPRCVLQSVLAGRSDLSGDYKLRCRAVEIADAPRRERYCEVIESRINWRPEEPYHLFAFDIGSVWAFNYAEGERGVRRWEPGAAPTFDSAPT